MNDDEPIEQRVIRRIGKTLDKIVPEGIVVESLAFEDIGTTGIKGYVFVLASHDEKRMQGCFFSSPPTPKQIHKGVADCIKVIRKGAKTA